MKAETLQHSGESAARVVGGGFEDAVLQRGLLQLTFGFFADFTFEIGIGRGEQTSVAGVDASLGVIDAGAEDFGGGQMDGNFLALDLDVTVLQRREIDAGDDFAMHDQQQAIANEKFGEIGIGVFAGNYFVHGVADGFEALEFLNLADDGGLIDVDDGAASAKRSEDVKEAESSG